MFKIPLHWVWNRTSTIIVLQKLLRILVAQFSIRIVHPLVYFIHRSNHSFIPLVGLVTTAVKKRYRYIPGGELRQVCDTSRLKYLLPVKVPLYIVLVISTTFAVYFPWVFMWCRRVLWIWRLEIPLGLQLWWLLTYKFTFVETLSLYCKIWVIAFWWMETICYLHFVSTIDYLDSL